MNNSLALAVGDDVGDLVRRQVGVDQREVQAGPFGGAFDLEQSRAVFHQDRDVVAPLQASRAQQVRGPIAPGFVVAIGHGLAGRGHDDGGLVGVLLSVLARVHASLLRDGGRCSAEPEATEPGSQR